MMQPTIRRASLVLCADSLCLSLSIAEPGELDRPAFTELKVSAIVDSKINVRTFYGASLSGSIERAKREIDFVSLSICDESSGHTVFRHVNPRGRSDDEITYAAKLKPNGELVIDYVGEDDSDDDDQLMCIETADGKRELFTGSLERCILDAKNYFVIASIRLTWIESKFGAKL